MLLNLIKRTYLKMFKDPRDCSQYGRTVQGPQRAKVLQISDLLALRRVSRETATGPNVRAWTYVLLSCSLFLRKAEASDLKIGDLEVPLDRVTGVPVMSGNLPRHIFVHIRRSKTDQTAKGA